MGSPTCDLKVIAMVADDTDIIWISSHTWELWVVVQQCILLIIQNSSKNNLLI